MLVLHIHVVYAYDEKLEPLLQTSPNIEATEYILIKNNDLDKSLDYLTKVIDTLHNDKGLDVEQRMRIAHLQYLTAYSYIFHISATLKKSEKITHAITTLDKFIPSLITISEKYPNYSDALRVLAVSRMLYGSAGLQGFTKFMYTKNTALEEITRAIQLNPQNMMARVVLNNFDSLAPRLAGAKPERGYSLIFIDIPPTLPKPQRFEVFMSRLHAYERKKQQKQVELTIDTLYSLYPRSWRIAARLHEK